MDESKAARFLAEMSEHCGRWPVELEEKLSDMGLDSLELTDIAIKLEVSPVEAAKCETVGDLFRLACVPS